MSDVLNSVRKMEESLKRLKQARRTAPATPAGPSGGGMSDDDKIRLQLALDVAYLGEQVTRAPPSFQGACLRIPRARQPAGGAPEPRDAGRSQESIPGAGKEGQGPRRLKEEDGPLGNMRKKRQAF